MPRRDVRTPALIAAIVGAALAWLSIGDAGHPLRPTLLVLGVAAMFSAGWPLCVPRPDDDDGDDEPWWTWGFAVSIVVGVGLGIGCALLLGA